MITVTYIFKKRFIGWIVFCDVFELSIHKGLRAWGITKITAIKKLNRKWNNLADENYRDLKKSSEGNPNITIGKLILTSSHENQI